MKRKVVCKTLLYEYRNLERYCEIVDSKLWRCGRTSMNKNVYEAVDSLIKLNNEKIAYCNIKVIIDEATSDKAELKAIYIDGQDFATLEAVTGLSQRTIFRKLAKQKERLYSYLINKYGFEYLFDLISDSKILLNKYKRFYDIEQQQYYSGGYNWDV